MKKIIYLILVVGIIAGASWFLLEKKSSKNDNQSIVTPEISDSKNELNNSNEVNQIQNQELAPAVDEKKFQFPLDRASERVTKKPFGIFIAPENSPVQPEKFSGYHTGADFEIFPEEENIDVIIEAVCSGKLLMKKYATGYGGMAVQSCDLEGEPITVVYGHLKLDSIKVALGDDIAIGEALGVLGKAYSVETSGERKHLHLGFHKGSEINILGYVFTKSVLSSWLDPMIFLKMK
ncbi:MAG: hypothetical protein UR66_C0001G0111 [Candidatus Moranbacteria bacterium GW2011_GWE1_35_17]|nr:MAG: hypothetical protein UR66_C0001G0111 [Candidatus Moranbacteria bacterium GW2011_GWE1_35_17]KKP73127.1 MAG: hypothetical protein UR65_C0007G0013 [Candidatus Moranbacteria bacterium GW2011_GWE2_35_164]KKP85169.1 MAG: hypothetical protein UR83_C0003G0004 [Candidatus Moranbacteria bacterium GW2011_GWF2_35_54]OGS62826.1 MAG: hypothetical protein A2X07_10895 [Flavobacteria bacterium GWF1_32_7]